MDTTDPTLQTLNTEWLTLIPGSANRLTEWACSEPDLAGAAGLADVLELIRVRPDAVLAALLRLGADGDPLAHRVVLQAMLGMAVRCCRGQPGLLPEALSELWLAIAEYPLARRPRCIAANLAWTVRRKLRCLPPQPERSLSLTERSLSLAERSVSLTKGTMALSPRAAGKPLDPDAGEVLAQARQLGLIDDVTHRTLWTVYVAGLTSQQAAEVLGTTAGAVRWRCSTALRRLARQAVLLAA